MLNGCSSLNRLRACHILIIVAAILCFSQTNRTNGQTPDPDTLHVFANLVQIPVLVLSESRRPLPPIDTSQFRLQLNTGKPFRLTHVRPEGDDPITLAILIDQSEKDGLPLTNLDSSIASLATRSLNPTDRVVFYGLHCNLTRSKPVSPLNPASLLAAVRTAMRTDTAPPSNPSPPCVQPIHVWAAIEYAMKEISTLPGRRVLLAITNGTDEENSANRIRLRDTAASNAVTLFALSGPFRGSPHELFLTNLCELSGGMVLYPNPQDLPTVFTQFITLLRQRYIVSFPLPRMQEAGKVGLLITLAKQRAFIRPSGINVPTTDPTMSGRPNTFLPDPSNAPEVGNRRILLKPQ